MNENTTTSANCISHKYKLYICIHLRLPHPRFASTELLATSAAEDFQDQYQTVGPLAVATVDAPRYMPHIRKIKTMEQRETHPYDKHSIIWANYYI